MTMTTPSLLAIFVGGRSRRMGTAKGLLEVPGGGPTIVEALVKRGRDAGLAPVLVGDATPYAHLVTDVQRLDDDPTGAGPLGGLRAVLLAAGDGTVHTGAHAAAGVPVVAVACDMPYVTASVLQQLVAHDTDAAVLAARRVVDALWEPMLARYRPAHVVPTLDALLAEGGRSFQALFSRLDVAELPLTAPVEEALRDWDEPADIRQ